MPSPHANDDPFLFLKAQGACKIDHQNPKHAHGHPADSSSQHLVDTQSPSRRQLPASNGQFTPLHLSLKAPKTMKKERKRKGGREGRRKKIRKRNIFYLQ